MPDSFEFFRLFIHPWGFGNLGPEILIFFFHWKMILWHSKHISSYCEGFQKRIFHALYTFTVSEISILYESVLCYFRNIHPLWEWLVLFQKYPSTITASCGILEIYSTIRGFCYFRNNHPLWDWLALFQKYPPTMRWAEVRGGIGDSLVAWELTFSCVKSVSEHIES